MSHLQPRLMCPFNYTSIQVTNAIVDLSFISHLPLDGYSWLIYLNLFENNNDDKKRKKKVFCITCKTTITKTHRNRGKQLQMKAEKYHIKSIFDGNFLFCEITLSKIKWIDYKHFFLIIKQQNFEQTFERLTQSATIFIELMMILSRMKEVILI